MAFYPRNNMDIPQLTAKSFQYRRQILEIIRCANAGHIGGCLSCVDILNVLYNGVMKISPESFEDPAHDRYVHSKGHSVQALYAVLADKGFFSYDLLTVKDRFGTKFIGHPTRDVPGIEVNTGALGHGLSVAAGMALAAKRDGLPTRVFTVLGDGELAEGSVWEAAIFISHYQLDNLTVIIDRNLLQITGPTEDVMKLEPLAGKFSNFGFAVRHVDGNHIPGLVDVLSRLPFETGKASLVLANTVKGKGVSFMENQPRWHHRVPTAEEYEAAMAELDAAEDEWKRGNNEPVP
jgi:transketolase